MTGSVNTNEIKGMSTVVLEKPEHYVVDFLETSQSYCVGIVDIVNSTKIAATLNKKKLSKYYEIFLNSMAKIVEEHGGFVIKNIGDCLLYYFPDSAESKSKEGFLNPIKCGLKMIQEHDVINEKMKKEKLPTLDYRISADYGEVTIMRTNYSSFIDVFGTPVNMSIKINHSAPKNGLVVGSDLYRLVKNCKGYKFKMINSQSIGLKYMYPIYQVQ